MEILPAKKRVRNLWIMLYGEPYSYDYWKHQDKLEDIIHDMKKHISSPLKAAIKNYPQESRREWIIWMMERAGRHGSNKDWQFWQQHNKPLEIKSQEMFDEKLAYYTSEPCAGRFCNKRRGLEV